MAINDFFNEDSPVARIDQKSYNKAIDDFAEVLRLKCLDSCYKEVSVYEILKLAKQLKAGDENGT